MTTPVLAVLGEPIVPDHRPNCAILSTIKRQLSYPDPHPPDIPVLISGSLLMMVGFTVCIAFALRIMPAGRSVVLAYTSPLWVYPAARIILGEEFDFIRTAGTLLGVGGIALLVGPWVLDWTGRDVVISASLLLTASMFWGTYIVHMRAHPLRTNALAIVTWQMVLAAGILLPLTFLLEGGLPSQAPGLFLR